MIEKCCIERLKKENEGLREEIEILEDEKEQYRQDYNTVAKECEEWHIKAHMTLGDNTFLKNTIKELEKKNENKYDRSLKILAIQETARAINIKSGETFERIAMQTMEECGELIQALSKYIRYDSSMLIKKGCKANILEEMADVILCLARIQAMCNFLDEDLFEIIMYKAERTIDRMKRGDK